MFSSRRRHSRLPGDWSSDVCSSDLAGRVTRRHVAGDQLQRGIGLLHPAHPVEHALRMAVGGIEDRKSTRLNSSHLVISYAVFCLKKKKKKNKATYAQQG